MKSQRDTYKNRPPLAEILERFDEVEVRRWWGVSGRPVADVPAWRAWRAYARRRG